MRAQSRQEHHKMLLVSTHPNGVDELYCPTCGRRILIQWPPDYQKTVLEPGDEYAIHSGGKGGLEMGVPQLTQGYEFSAQEAAVRLSAHDEARLLQWEQWLDQIGFDNWWDDSV